MVNVRRRREGQPEILPDDGHHVICEREGDPIKLISGGDHGHDTVLTGDLNVKCEERLCEDGWVLVNGVVKDLVDGVGGINQSVRPQIPVKFNIDIAADHVRGAELKDSEGVVDCVIGEGKLIAPQQ